MAFKFDNIPSPKIVILDKEAFTSIFFFSSFHLEDAAWHYIVQSFRFPFSRSTTESHPMLSRKQSLSRCSRNLSPFLSVLQEQLQILKPVFTRHQGRTKAFLRANALVETLFTCLPRVMCIIEYTRYRHNRQVKFGSSTFLRVIDDRRSGFLGGGIGIFPHL